MWKSFENVDAAIDFARQSNEKVWRSERDPKNYWVGDLPSTVQKLNFFEIEVKDDRFMAVFADDMNKLELAYNVLSAAMLASYAGKVEMTLFHCNNVIRGICSDNSDKPD